MHRSQTTWAFLAISLVVLLTTTPAHAQDRKVLEVVTVDTHGKTSEYIASLKPLMARIKELDPQVTFKVWEAWYSGEFVGTVYVTVEYPSMAAMATMDQKRQSDAQFQKLLQAVAATGRTITARSLLNDRTP